MTRDRDAVLDRVGQALPSNPDALDRLQVRRDRKVMRRRVAGGIIGLGVAAIIVASALTLLETNRSSSPSQPLTRSPGRLVAAPGEYYYARITSGTTTNERWFAPDGSGRFTTSIDGVLYDDRSFAPGELSGKLYGDLSTDVEELISQLSERSAPGGASPIAMPTPAPSPHEEELILLAMSDLLVFGSDYLVPLQTAAIFQAASVMPGVAVDRGADALGRDAITLSWNFRDADSAVLVRWYFEPHTEQFMGEQRFDSATGGGVFGQSLVEVAGIVGSTDERPTPSARYVPRAHEGVLQEGAASTT